LMNFKNIKYSIDAVPLVNHTLVQFTDNYVVKSRPSMLKINKGDIAVKVASMTSGWVVLRSTECVMTVFLVPSYLIREISLDMSVFTYSNNPDC